MNDFDDQVRDALAEAAQPVAPAPDWDDLTRRIARRERRRGAAFALAVVMLVAVIGGTVALQRSRAPRARVASPGSAPAGDQVVATHTPLPTLRNGAIGPSTSGFALAQGSISKGVSAGGAGSSGDAASAPMIGPMMPCCVAMYPVRDLAKVFVRSGNGVVVRVYAAKTAEPTWSGPPWWTPPPWCFPTEVVEAEVSTDSAVGIAAGSLYAQRREGPVGGDATIVGVAEHDPTWIVVAQAPPGAARVRATFPDGTHDEMTPVDGVAVLSRPAASTTGTITVEAFNASGTSLGSAAITAPGSSARIDPAQCNAPQQLPPPGPSQPADPAAAHTTINNLVVSAFSDRSLSDAQVFALYDDSHGFADVLKQLRSGSFKNEVAAARVSKLDGLVFLSATKAALEFTINIPNYSSFSQRFGEAVLVDGTWKLTRATFCNQVSLAGVQCPP